MIDDLFYCSSLNRMRVVPSTWCFLPEEEEQAAHTQLLNMQIIVMFSTSSALGSH